MSFSIEKIDMRNLVAIVGFDDGKSWAYHNKVLYENNRDFIKSNAVFLSHVSHVIIDKELEW